MATTTSSRQNLFEISPDEIWKTFYSNLSNEISLAHQQQHDIVKWIVTTEFALLGFYFYRMQSYVEAGYIWFAGFVMLNLTSVLMLLLYQRAKKLCRIRIVTLMKHTNAEFRNSYFEIMRVTPLVSEEDIFNHPLAKQWQKNFSSFLWWDRHILTFYFLIPTMPLIVFLVVSAFHQGAH